MVLQGISDEADRKVAKKGRGKPEAAFYGNSGQ
jgi:hypothetical protein